MRIDGRKFEPNPCCGKAVMVHLRCLGGLLVVTIPDCRNFNTILSELKNDIEALINSTIS